MYLKQIMVGVFAAADTPMMPGCSISNLEIPVFAERVTDRVSAEMHPPLLVAWRQSSFRGEAYDQCAREYNTAADPRAAAR